MKKLIAVLAGVLLLLPSLTMALEPFNKDLRYGMTKNAEVKRMQEFLRDEGLYQGAITGNYYALTRQSVRDLQKREGLKITGVFDKATREVLNSRSGEVVISNEDNWLDEWIKNTPPISPVVVSNQQPSVVINNPQPFVPTPTPIIFTDTSTITPTGSPTGTTMDTTAPVVTFNRASYATNAAQLIFGRSKYPYGSIENICTNCIVVITDEPTKLSLKYHYNNEPENTKTISDDLKNIHIIMDKNIFTNIKEYRYGINDNGFSYQVEVEDASGNKFSDPTWHGGSIDPAVDSYVIIDGVRTMY